MQSKALATTISHRPVPLTNSTVLDQPTNEQTNDTFVMMCSATTKPTSQHRNERGNCQLHPSPQHNTLYRIYTVAACSPIHLSVQTPVLLDNQAMPATNNAVSNDTFPFFSVLFSDLLRFVNHHQQPSLQSTCHRHNRMDTALLTLHVSTTETLTSTGMLPNQSCLIHIRPLQPS